MLNPKPARYEARFRNGIWQVFDRQWYGAVQAADTQKAAERKAAALNRRHS